MRFHAHSLQSMIYKPYSLDYESLLKQSPLVSLWNMICKESDVSTWIQKEYLHKFNLTSSEN